MGPQDYDTKMHKKAKLLSLEQRRSLQLLHLMYIHKENVNNIRNMPRYTRAARRDNFYVERYNNLKYKNSPFYKGVELWNLLPLDIATSDSLFQCKHSMKKKYKTFCDTTTLTIDNYTQHCHSYVRILSLPVKLIYASLFNVFT